MERKILNMNIGFRCLKRSKKKAFHFFLSFLLSMTSIFRIDHLYAFFLRWTPDRTSDPTHDDNHSDHLLTHTLLKYNELSPSKGFVLLANDDPELSDDYISSNNNSSKTRTNATSSDSGTDKTKKQHYLKRQNTLLKEWEVIIILKKQKVL